MEHKEGIAYPLLGYDILANPAQPTLAVIAFQTATGTHLFAAYREILEQLAEAFRRHASQMPRKRDEH